MKKKLFAILCIFILLISMLCACGASSVTQESASVDKFTAGSIEPEAAPMENYSYAAGITDSASSEETSPSLDSTVETGTDITMKIIYSADVDLETMDFDATITALEQSIARFGGFVEHSEVNGDSSYDTDGTAYLRNRHAYYTVRIPADKLGEFMGQTGSLGNIVSSNKSAQNVTSQYTDHEARLTSYQTQETRLLELIAEADDIDALITLESKLADVRYEIESIQRSLRDLDSKLAYSTVNLSIREVELYQPTATVKRSFWQRLGDAFVRGWRGFIRSAENFFVWFAGSIFTLILLGAIGTACFFMGRRIIRKRKTKKEKKSKEE